MARPERESEPIAIRLDEAAVLVPALLSNRAASAGIRTLVVKGIVPALQGLRSPKVSNDVDILVEPRQHENLVALMINEGWVPRAAVEHPWFLPDHSVTLWHPTWPCEVDVHRFYPGFLAAPGAAFDELWNAHEVTELAHCPVNVCAPAGNVAILALHGLRNGGLRGMDEEYERLVARVAGDPALAAAVARVAERTGAVATLDPFLDAVGTSARNGVPVSSADLAAWRLLIGGDATPTLAWLHELTRTPVWGWPRVMWRALTYTDDHQATARRSGRWLRRALRGLRSIPASIGSLRGAGSNRR